MPLLFQSLKSHAQGVLAVVVVFGAPAVVVEVQRSRALKKREFTSRVRAGGGGEVEKEEVMDNKIKRKVNFSIFSLFHTCPITQRELTNPVAVIKSEQE